MSGMALAGCLSEADPDGDDDDKGDNDGGDNTDDGDGSDPGGDGDADDLSIDGRLHNEADAAQEFTVTIRDADDEEVVSDQWEVEAGETLAVPAVGKPGEPRTFEVTVDGASATETLDFDVEQVPEMKDGYVDITYTAEDAVEIVFTPIDHDAMGGELPRVDEPPYEITEPECSGADERDPLWLCENMDAEPSLGFDQADIASTIFADEGLYYQEEAGDAQYYATLLTDADDMDRVHPDAQGETVDLIEETDFDEEVVLVVETGWGSGSHRPHLKRIEETDSGIHAYGCYRRPCVQTDDYTVRTVAARIDRPDSLKDGLVSLTVDAETRVNIEIGEGVVTVTDHRS